jgi:hypothetical protein
MAHRPYGRAAMTAVGLATLVASGAAHAQTRQRQDCRYEPNRRVAAPYFVDHKGCLWTRAGSDADATGTVAEPFAARRANATAVAPRAGGAVAQVPAQRWPDCRYEPNFPIASPYWIDHNGCLRMRSGNEDAFVSGSIGPANGNPTGPVGADSGIRPSSGTVPTPQGGAGTGRGPVTSPPTGAVSGIPAATTPTGNSPIADSPNTQGPKTEGPKTEGPKSEGPKTEGPKSEGPKTEGPKSEGPKGDAPKGGGPKGGGPNGGGKGHGSEKGNNGIGNGPDPAPHGLAGRGAEGGFNDGVGSPSANPGGQTPGSGNASARDGEGGGRGNSKGGK